MPWWKVLYKVSDQDINKYFGTDYAIIGSYLRMCAYVFLVTTIFDIIVLFPVYITG